MGGRWNFAGGLAESSLERLQRHEGESRDARECEEHRQEGVLPRLMTTSTLLPRGSTAPSFGFCRITRPLIVLE
jgi:hypothetical protein